MLDNEPNHGDATGDRPDHDATEVTSPIRRTRRRTTKATGDAATVEPAAGAGPAGAQSGAAETVQAASGESKGGESGAAAPAKVTRSRRKRTTAAAPAEGAAAPEEPAPSARAESAPVESAPVESAPVESAPARVKSARAKSAPARAGAAGSVPAEPAPAAAGHAQPGVAEREPAGDADGGGEREETSGRRRRRSLAAPALLFVAPEVEAPPRAEPAQRREPAQRPESAQRPAAGDGASRAEDTADLPSEQGEPYSRTRRRRRRGAETADLDVVEAVAEPAAREAQQTQAEDEDADLDENGRRRRRRGRRGRGRGKGTADTDEQMADESVAAATEAAEEEEGDTLTRRRRRRRRRGAEADESAGEDDGVPTVVKIREPQRSVRDEVQGVTGSTRLEAKRQRRRDGREQRRTRPPILSESEFLARREAVERVMAVRQRGDRTQIAVLEDGVLVEHYVTRSTAGSMVGNVYLGKVQNVLPSMEAAFVDIGRGRNAVLYAGEVNWDASGLEGRARSIEQALKPGDTVLVQVTKDPVGHKGARLTSHVALSGRHLVYVPHGNASGISRKLPDIERKRLRDLLKKMIPEGAGVIVRTAAEGAREDDLARDIKRLQAQWEDIQVKATDGNAPALLYEEPDLVIRVVRDLFNEDFKELVIQGGDAYDTVEPYLAHVSPDLVVRLRKYVGTGDVFHDQRIDEQLLKGLDRKVYLPSGGHLVIDRTEAMTVIDVNTGKYTGAGGNLEETVTRNNIEAAEEIVRQLRLRDIGGIIVIDFIDMVLESNRELVLRRLTECLGRDRTKHQVTEITSLGLVQMTRKRIGQGLLEAFSETCEHCKGRGVVINLDPVGERPRPVRGAAAAEPARGEAAEPPSGSGTGRRGRRRGAQAGGGETGDGAAGDRGGAAVSGPTADLVEPDGTAPDDTAMDDTGRGGIGPDMDEPADVDSPADEELADLVADLEEEPSGGHRRGRRGGSRRRRS